MTTPIPPPDPESPAAEREERIRELEARSKKRGFGVRWTTALMAIALAVGLFAWFRVDRELAYYFSPAEPITLGTEGEYHFDRLRSNRYAQVHGIPTETGIFLRDKEALSVMVGLQNTPLIVVRGAVDTESDRPPTPVDQRPFGLRGRLLEQDDAGPYARGVEELSRNSALVPRDGKLWLLVEGRQPRTDASPLVLSGFLVAFVGLNLWFLVRDLSRRLRRG